LFASTVSTGSVPLASDVVAIVKATFGHRTFGQVSGDIAYAYGRDPINACTRMRWALEVIRGIRPFASE
jgi:hypothetical protein